MIALKQEVEQKILSHSWLSICHVEAKYWERDRRSNAFLHHGIDHRQGETRTATGS